MALIDPKDLDKLRYVQYNDICRGFNMAIDLIQDKAEELSVDAIPVEWISNYIHTTFEKEEDAQDIIVMCYVWNVIRE